MVLIKAVKETTGNIDDIFEKLEIEQLSAYVKSHMTAKHPLRKMLDATDAYILGRSLDMFHLYRCNRWKIDKAIRDRSFEDLPTYTTYISDIRQTVRFNPQEFLNLIVYNKLQGNLKYRKGQCPERFRDVLCNGF